MPPPRCVLNRTHQTYAIGEERLSVQEIHNCERGVCGTVGLLKLHCVQGTVVKRGTDVMIPPSTIEQQSNCICLAELRQQSALTAMD